jgi:antitoxin component HigA of HigAB toxin-antitoxin module
MNFIDLIDNIRKATEELAASNAADVASYEPITPEMAQWLLGQEQRPCVEVMHEFMEKFGTCPEQTGKLFGRWFLRDVA